MRRCLILDDDDEDIEGAISAYKKKLYNYEPIEYDAIGIAVGDDYNASFPRTLKQVLDKLKNGNYVLFACDMQLGLGEKNGYDIIQEVCKSYSSLPIILYSGDFPSLARLLADRLSKSKDENAEDILRALTHIRKIVDRSENLEDHILCVLNENVSIYQVLQVILQDNPSLVLNIGHSAFIGKTFGEIAKMMSDEKHNANIHRFVEDVIEHVIHHLGTLNKNA